MEKKSDKTVSFIGLSLLLHSAVAFALAIAPELFPRPEGIVEALEIEFTALKAPQGNQLKTLDVGEIESEAPTQPEESQPDVKEIKEDKSRDFIAVVPPPAPKKKKKAKAKAKISKKLKLKPVKTETITQSPVPVVLPTTSQKKDNWAKLKEEMNKEILANDLAGKEDFNDGFEDVEDNNEVEEKFKALAAAAITDKSVKKNLPQQLAQPQIKPKKIATSPPAILPGAPQKSNRLIHKSNMVYGVPTGIRDYKDLVQVPGNVPPQYPENARKRRFQGSLELKYFVTPDGKVSNLVLIKSSGYDSLDNEALRAIRKYRYNPGQQGFTSHVINFKLRGQAKPAGGLLRTTSRAPRNSTTN